MTKTTLLKTLSIFIIFAVLLALLPGGFIAVTATTAESGTCGDNLTWTLSNGVLTISGTGNMYNYSYEYLNDSYITTAPWGPKSFSSVIIEPTVTNIGDNAFYGCTRLKKVTIPESVTTIGACAFYGCTALTSVTIPDGVTSIGKDAFSYCTGLTSVYITDIAAWCAISFNTSTSNPVFYAHNLYLNGGLVTELVIPDSVTSIGDNVFRNCTALTSVTIPKNVTSIGYAAFYQCTALTSVTMPDGVISIGEDAFYYCTSLTSVNITDIASWCAIGFSNYGSNPLSYGTHNLYLNGELVTNLVIPDSVTSIGDWAFFHCSSLMSVTMSDSVTSIGYSAFANCNALTGVTIGNGVTSIGKYVFYYCDKMTAYIYRNTYGESYVKSNGIKYNYVSPSGIAISCLPDILSYLEAKGEFNATGGKLTLNYDNGYSTEIGIRSNMVSGFDNTVVGQQTLTVTCDGLTATFDVDIIAKTLTDMRVTSLPNKTRYIESYGGLDLAGGKYTLYYNNDTTETFDITADMISGFDITSTGKQALTVAYGDFVDTFEVEVVPKSIESIAVTRLPAKTSYLQAKETLDIAGGVLTVYFDNGTAREAYMVYNNGSASLMFADDFSIAPLVIGGFKNSVAGVCTVTVEYKEFSASFDVEIVAKELCDIIFDRVPTKTVYEIGEALDLTGARIKLSYNNDTYQYANLITVADMTRMVIEGESASHEVGVSGFDSNCGGKKTVAITYGGFKTSVEVIVNGSVMKGDPDGDGEITVADALIALRVAAKLFVPTEDEFATCDIDGDGEITVSDALRILRVAAKLINASEL